MNPALRDFWARQSRFKVLYGGRGSSKSWDAAANSVRVARTIPARILCTRMYQNRIEESVYTTIKKQIERFGLNHEFRILNNKIIHNLTGSEYLFYGLARNIDEIKSLEGVDILWVEEAHALTPEMWELLEPTIRKEHSEIWIVFNPNLATDFAYRRFVVNPPPDTVVRKINYDENPFLSNTLLKTITDLKEEDYESYEHIYEGVPKPDDDAVIIKRSWINSAIDAHKKLNIEPTGIRKVGYDVADSGDDKNATCNRHGILIWDTQQWGGGEDQLMESCQRTYATARKDKAIIVYDSVGVGAGCGSKFSELNASQGLTLEYHAFNAGGKVVDPDREYEHGVLNKNHFSNIKAQAWWLVADRFRRTYDAIHKGAGVDPSNIVSIDSGCSNLEQLITELSSPKRSYDGAGRVKVETKEDMAKRGLPSPNLADAFIMCFAPRETDPFKDGIQTGFI